MYDNHRKPWQCQASICTCLFAAALMALGATTARAQELQSTSVIRKISSLSDKMELTTNTSRILTLDKNIPRVQVNNPDLLAVTPLSATQVQISAKKAGVTQVNLWDEEGKVHSIDVLIYGDARELEVALQTQFPHASIKVFRYSESLVLTGYVDRPDHVSPIMQLAADYSPKVINNIQVGGVQQILLKVKVMEMSRTKLRRFATDFSVLGGNGGFFSTGVSGLLQNTSNGIGGAQSVVDTAGKAAEFGIVHGDGAFFGFIDWLQQNNIAKILSEPNIVAVSGRPAQFQVGGEFPIVVPQSLGTASIEFKPYGTQIDFLPIVLGNGKIRLEVRPRISEIDPARSIVIQNFTVPALTTRQVDTAVEMQAGQTFALAGLVQERTEGQMRGLPYVSDMPIIGVPFRKTENEVNEIELLIMVTPEFVDAMDPCEVPCGGPGTYTTSPNNRGLYCAAHMEVPTACNPTSGLGSCGQNPCGGCNGGCNGGCQCNGGAQVMNAMPMQGMPGQMPTPMTQLPGGAGYDDSSNGVTVLPSPDADPSTTTTNTVTDKTVVTDKSPAPQDLKLPESQPKPVQQAKPIEKPATPPLPPQPSPSAAPGAALPKPVQTPPAAPVPGPAPNSGSYNPATQPADIDMPPANSSAQAPVYGVTRPFRPLRQPVFVRNASSLNNPQVQQQQPATPARETSLIGPVGYEQ